jgi:hypothetical protein
MRVLGSLVDLKVIDPKTFSHFLIEILDESERWKNYKRDLILEIVMAALIICVRIIFMLYQIFSI